MGRGRRRRRSEQAGHVDHESDIGGARPATARRDGARVEPVSAPRPRPVMTSTHAPWARWVRRPRQRADDHLVGQVEQRPLESGHRPQGRRQSNTCPELSGRGRGLSPTPVLLPSHTCRPSRGGAVSSSAPGGEGWSSGPSPSPSPAVEGGQPAGGGVPDTKEEFTTLSWCPRARQQWWPRPAGYAARGTRAGGPSARQASVIDVRPPTPGRLGGSAARRHRPGPAA